MMKTNIIHMYRKTFIEINAENLKYNVETLVKNYPDYKYYIRAVKGNAYGHGWKVVKSLIDAGINYLAVSTLEEALYWLHESWKI